MATHKVVRGDKVYLSEYKSVRKGKKVTSVFVRYLGEEKAIKAGKKPKKRVLDRIDLNSSNRAGDVRLLWEIARDLDFIKIIDRICCQNPSIEGPSPGKFLTVWAINRVIDPESCTQLERWVKTTDLPLLTGIEPEAFTKDAFLSSLDFICRYDSGIKRNLDYTPIIEDTLYQKWRNAHPLPPGKKETIAYDITSILFFGVTCPLALFGDKAKKTQQMQVNLALIVSKYDKYAINHFVYQGNRQSSSTIKNLIARLADMAIDKGTIIWDRGNVSKAHVNSIESAGWKLICGVPKTSNEAKNIIKNTNVPIEPDTFVHKSKSDHLYAVKTKGKLFGKERFVTVYVNQERRSRKINNLNLALAEIGEKLDELSEMGKDWSEAKLHKAIKGIVEDWKVYFDTPVKRKGNGPRINWKLKTREISKRKKTFGKYIIHSTDEVLSAKEVIKAYFEKDFIEKVFRTFKTTEEIEPVRHRKESRVRAYLFVCVLAYRLLAALHLKFEEAVGKEGAWERTYDLIRDLGRVERTEIGFGKEVKTWFLNVTKNIKDNLKKIGMKDLLKEENRLNV